MTVDKFLTALLALGERVASSLEAIVESQGIVAETIEPPTKTARTKPAAVVPSDDDDDLSEFDDPEGDGDDLGGDDDDLDEDPPPASKKKTTKKSAKKKTSKKKKTVGKKAATSEFSEEDVREKLQELQLCTGDARLPKSVLKKHGASTLGGLDEAKRGKVIADLQSEIDQYED